MKHSIWFGVLLVGVGWGCSGETIGQPPGGSGGTGPGTGGTGAGTGGVTTTTGGGGGTNPAVDPCIRACRYVGTCLGSDSEPCSETCSEIPDLTEAEARATASCLLQLTCAQLADPTGTAVVACIEP